jgi:hypothetical protein
MTVKELIAAGGPEAFAEAAEEAATSERQFWLRALERWQRDNEPDYGHIGVSVIMYIRELRRKLGIKPPKELIREQTRERVRRFRERQRGEVCG